VKSLNPLRGLGNQEVRLLVLLGAGSFMLMSNLSSINVALPHIQRDFETDLTTVKWVSIVGFIVAASLSLCFGRVGDIYGRTRVYRLGLAVYALGALFCTLAPTLATLIAARVVMAVGLGMASPLATAIIAASVAPERRGQIVGLFLSFAAAGQLVGPTVGGLVLSLTTWRGIFLVNFFLAVFLVLAQLLWLGANDKRQQGRLDLLGALLLLAAYPAFLIALSMGPRAGWSDGSTLAWFGAAVLGLMAFVWREVRYPAPLVSYRLLRSPNLGIALFLLAITAFVQNPITLYVPVYLQTVLELDALRVGVLMMVLPLSTLIAGPIGGRLADRFPPRLVAGAGVALLGLGVLAYAGMDASTAALLVVVPLVLSGVAGGLFRPANQVAAFATVRQEDYGSVSAIQTSLMMLAGTLGTTIAVAISESVASGTDAASFAAAQRITFLCFLPLLLAGVIVSVAAAKRGRSATATSTLEPASETRVS